MLRLNDVSRFAIADIAVQRVTSQQPDHRIGVKAHELGSFWKHRLVLHEKYTVEHGEDPDWCSEIPKIKEGVA